MIIGALTGIVHSRNLNYKFNTYLGTNADKDLPNWSINFSDIVSFSKFRNYTEPTLYIECNTRYEFNWYNTDQYQHEPPSV